MGLKKKPQVIPELLRFTKDDLNQLEQMRSYVSSYELDPQTISRRLSAYESILAAAPSRLQQRDHRMRLYDHDKFLWGKIISNEMLSMIGLTTMVNIDRGVYHSFYYSTFTVEKDGIYCGGQKLIIDFDLIFDTWNRSLVDHVCIDAVSIIVGYLHGDIDFRLE